MKDSLLVLNGGSSSVKISLFDCPDKTAKEARKIWSKTLPVNLLESGITEVNELLSELFSKMQICAPEIFCIGHRVVHGGTEFRESVPIDDQVEKKIEELCELAPVHNPIALKLIRASRALLPEAVHLAVFDTSFHSTMPESAFIYPLPYAWFEELGIRRFGFHGINHQYCLHAAARLLQSEASSLAAVSCHLGNGCSLAAIKNGRSIDTSMGYTPLEGLMMGARSGSVDPGILFHLIRKGKFSAEGLDHLLNNASGLLGVSGISKDMQSIEAAIISGNARAKLAFDIFARKVGSGIAAMAASLGGLDTLIFTAGIGEHSARLRQTVCHGLSFLGIDLDDDLNLRCSADAVISSPASRVKVLRIEAREDLQIARECLRLTC